MKIAIMQPYLFPYIGYFQMIKEVDLFVIFDDVNFIKKGWINRNNILLNDAKYTWTLPLINASQNRLIKDTNIFEPEKNKNKLLKLFDQAYKKSSATYDSVFPMIQEIMLNPSDNIVDFIEHSFKVITNYLDISTNFIRSSSITNPNSLRAQERIIDITKRLGGTTYINSIGGTELYQKEAFKNEGLEINFVRTEKPHNTNISDDSIYNLSIIEILFKFPKSVVTEYLNNYKLV